MNDETQQTDAGRLEKEEIEDLGTVTLARGGHVIHCLTVIGQIEGHSEAPQGQKTTKYEHVIPQLVAAQHIINIRTTAGKTLAMRQSFKAFTEPLKKDPRFFVCGRGTIINMENAADFQDAAFCMTDGSQVYVSQELLKAARQAFMEFLLQRGRVG